RDGHDFLELSGRRTLRTVELNGRAYWDAVRYRGRYPFDYGSGVVVNVDRSDADVVGGELRAHWPFAASDVLTVGAEAQSIVRALLQNIDEGAESAPYVGSSGRAELGGIYAQNEHRLGRTLIVTAGARLDLHQDRSPVANPRVDVVWRLAHATTLKMLAGRAYRAPSFSETDYYEPNRDRTYSPGAERISTVEATLERVQGPVTIGWTVYDNRLHDLIDLVAIDSAGTLAYQNRASLVTHGVETEILALLGSHTRARLALAIQDSDLEDSQTDVSNSPHWNAHVVITHAPNEGPLSVGFGTRLLG